SGYGPRLVLWRGSGPVPLLASADGTEPRPAHHPVRPQHSGFRREPDQLGRHQPPRYQPGRPQMTEPTPAPGNSTAAEHTPASAVDSPLTTGATPDSGPVTAAAGGASD